MKFLCDNCKAKYQIGDEKVAGKTVRMKCRKCGHSITVSAKVTESSVSRQFPADPAAAPDSGRFPTGEVADAPGAPPRREEDESTQIMQMPVVMRPTAPLRPAPPRAPTPRPIGGAPPRASAPPRPIAAVRASGASPAVDLRAQATPSPVAQAPAHDPAAGAVAAAFQRAVADPNATSAARPAPHEDWYVGVGGVPLGPVRVEVIREKAELGQVDGESLVWREGFDEWQPLKKFPELLEVVHATRMAKLAHASSKTTAMPVSPEPARAPAPAPAAALTPTPAALTEPLQTRADAPAVTGPVGVMADPFAKPMADPFAKPRDEAGVALGPARPAPEAPEVASPFAAPTAGAAPIAPSYADLPPRRAPMHPMAYAFIAMAAVFGGVAAYFLFFKPVPQPQVVIVEKTVQAPAAAPTSSGGDAPAAAAPSAEASAAPTQRVATGGPLRGALPKPSAPGAGEAKANNPIDTSGFSNGGVSGPSANGGPGAAGPSGGQLSQGEIQGVVSSNQARIRRGCWEPALAGRAANAPSSARVNASITIGASGAVEHVNASGADAYPGLASCIASRLKTLHFPPSGGSTTVSVPFVFAAQ